PHVQHGYLVLWHATAAIHFLAFLLLSARLHTLCGQRRCLIAFLALGSALFTWFGFISWSLSGDLSIYAIFLLTMVCVLSFPGRLRKVLCLASAGALLLCIYRLDGRDIFYTSGAAMNLAALAAVALLLDVHLMRLNRALYREQQRVQQERERADKVLYNALPRSIADELKINNVVKAKKYPRMAVLFVDIVGFTDFSAHRPPQAVVEILGEIFCMFDNLVDRYDVEKIKTIGDAYMVVGKDDAAPVADLALDMLDAMAQYRRRSGYPLDIRAGLHVGATVAGVIGRKRFLYDVWGDAVNIASRMESSGQAGKIQVTEVLALALQQTFRFSAPAQVQIKGKGPMCTRFLLERRHVAAAAAADPDLPRAMALCKAA
ncbi:MAG: adenylate/guanylate cyclase domain-containing protein, partial [Betaproteobacteria bacterium]